jgi:hypothetical protein
LRLLLLRPRDVRVFRQGDLLLELVGDLVGEVAIELFAHFAGRNEFFRANPRRAGKTISGQETTPSASSASNNCKDPRRCFYGI